MEQNENITEMKKKLWRNDKIIKRWKLLTMQQWIMSFQ